MRRDPRRAQTFRVLRSVAILLILTVGAVHVIDGEVSRPHGHPLLYALAMSWLISMAVAVLTSPIFRAHPALFRLARWENEGAVYERRSIRAFRWVLLHSPLGWINPNLHLSPSRADCDRLLAEMRASEGVHWLTCLLASLLAVSYIARDYAVYGYVMLLVRIPFDVYPVMLQRWNRGRLRNMMSRTRRAADDARGAGISARTSGGSDGRP